ncbi:MAG: hypothetical protein Q8P24_21155 [Desulfobacterales bacterium]|nr:hypothetical protein [Desulfobacterales bacterium]MDZ4242895.1 hypothetical protein [Candidatus Omnitrophota bacterium]
MENSRIRRLFQTVMVPLLICLILPGLAFSQTPFYQGKKIKLIQGRPPGGTGDIRVRALVPFLQKHIPGNPTIVMMYKPGGGGRSATNYIYNSSRPDGLTIANVGAGFISNAVLGEHGVRYDIDKMSYLGSANSRTSYIFYSNSKLGLDTLEKLKSYPGLRVGGQSVGHDIYINGRLFAWLLDLKEPKFVTGYSGPEMDIALIRGELDARAQIPDNVPKRNPEFIEKNQVYFHAVNEFPPGFRTKLPIFAKYPALHSFARTDIEKKVLRMFVNFRMIGSPYFLPPDTPPQHVKTLQEAFSKALQDPEFLDHFKKLVWVEAQPLLWDEQTKTIQDIPRTQDVIKVFNIIAGADPLPPR